MKIAIVGSGIAGLAAAHWLRGAHEIEVFEGADWIGGHAHTVPLVVGGVRCAVDTGFVVWNERNYPAFGGLMAELGVASQPTEMSFSVRCERGGLEYAGGSLGALFADPRNLARPSFLRMVRDVLRFYREARAFLLRPDPKVALGAWLDACGFGPELAAQHVIPMAAAIWSADPREVRGFPALTLLRFFENHGLLSLRERPCWRVISGGSARYVEALVAPFRERIRLRCPVRCVRRRKGGVELVTADGAARRYDEVVLALHGDEALALLAEPTRAERALLGAIRYQGNDVVLHTDARLLPRRRRARASWNYLVPAAGAGAAIVTYDMNRLQGLGAPLPVCVTLNPGARVAPHRVLRRFVYRHPVLDAAAVEAQAHASEISGTDRIHYAGAYWGSGFHEDGVRSALRVAAHFGLGPR